MKFYVASKFENKLAVRDTINFLKAAGHEVTYDWTDSITSNIAEAYKDLTGVINADVVIGLFDREFIYKGALIEVGIALSLNKTVYIIGDYLDSVIFMKLPHLVKIKNIESILDKLKLMG